MPSITPFLWFDNNVPEAVPYAIATVLVGLVLLVNASAIAFRVYLRWPATRETADARRAAKTTTGIIAHALLRLSEAGLLRRCGDDCGERVASCDGAELATSSMKP